ncbi:hypothetical protein E4191_07215 [Paracoccus liaowanqingii]|uniref:Uncharacterized protein n=1 Tax=Paracoccus liaowanqingii TaxID=2560053 RepID=A0A4P7HK88_9RHOB|nr:hypothetical protein [Paracoccus liaowanqingii]QBX34526.1 hypothetical protein E4191_07215 [Paracoccus liaowanqingii]
MTDHMTATPEEQRALSQEELGFANQSRQPALGQLSDKDLSDLIGLLRVRRNRARDIAARQGREARGKVSPSGKTSAGGNEGTRSKAEYLTAALDRATEERDRRDAGGSDGASQTELAEKAMQLKAEADRTNPMVEDGGAIHPNDPDADPGKGGMGQTERTTAPSGALDHAGELPARERSRTRT